MALTPTMTRSFLLALSLLLLPAPALAQGYEPVDLDDDDEPPPRGDGGGDDDDDAGGGGSGGDIPEVLRPGTKPMFFVGAIGPTFFGINRDFDARDGSRGKLALDFGYHLDGAMEGPAIGGTIEQTFSGSFYVLNPAFKFWWDIQPVDDLGLTIAPFAKAGYAGVFCDGDVCPGHAFDLGFGVEGRLVLDDVGLVLVRPIQFDNYLGDIFDESFLLTYSFLVGGGLIF